MKPAINYSKAEEAKKNSGHCTSGASWDGIGIDYDTRLRFVNVGGVRLWEHGAFDVLHGGRRNPAGRKRMSKTLGAECVKANEHKGKLFTPEGLEVRKSQLVGNPALWIDREHDMVVNASYYNPLKYACQSSPPIPQRKLKVAFPDKQDDKKKWLEIKKWIDWVNAQRNLGGECPDEAREAYDRDHRINSYIVKSWVQAGGGSTGAAIWLLWKNPGWESLARKYFIQQNKIIREYPWLKTTKPA